MSLNVSQLRAELDALAEHMPPDCQVRLIVNGIAHPVDQVWFEPRQERVGAICIGDDPR
jgi:hypothetical protein